ncbi:response regulator [Lacinutrix sp. C3R15]|uniref:tetratricopeptide repeat-containing hybrid sensor histidine kinase/response regulator n=1 Tax=Flavobacteriaceae TaxID=49546 RepID=UPI001C095C9E|nr:MULTISPECIES: ATP-binding protein [Flavobacteriaceae]MBU2941026.1 response regulator [Lacinutrix sp. C3R15]MDO6624345.1 ATP-binding protein [Oceanihabitans sp. 1_MG-2023]
MKRVLFAVLLLVTTPLLLQAQDISDKEADSINDVLLRVNDLNNKSEYGKAVALAKQTLEYLEDSKRYKLIGKTLNGLAFSYAELKDKDKAFQYSFQALDYFIKAKDTLSIVVIYNDIGVTYEDFGLIEEANNAYQQAIDVSRLSNKPHKYIIYPKVNIAKNLIEYSGNYKKGLAYLNKAIHTSKKLGLDEKKDHVFVQIFLSYAYALHKLKQFDASEIYFQKALDLASNEKYLRAIEGIYSKKTKLYTEDGDYKEALNMMGKYIEIRDSINTIDNMSLAKTIEARYKVKESEEKLSYLTKEKNIKEAQLVKYNQFMALLCILIALLILTTYWTIKKNKQLQLARDVAENLSKVKSDFYSEISHELRTPLYAVIELSNLLQKEDLKVQHKEYLESLQFSGNQLLSLINNVLELNKMDSETIKIEQTKFYLKDIISNTIDSIEFALNESNNEICLDYDDTIPKELVGDALKLTQVFINLISNATKFTNNGTITVTAKMIKESANDVKIHFEVIDTGLGIAKEKQSLIFENFYQEHAKIEKSYRGTGLGLSIVKEILKAMGGEIKIESEEGKGSTFYFDLKFNKGKETSKLNDLQSKQLKEIEGKRVLIVDDNKINQLVTRKVVDHLNIKSSTVDSGQKAITLIKKESFDCVLMDLHMPQLDGYETTKIIREFNTEIPIVALTAAFIDDVEEKIKQQGMDGYILKPFNKSVFVVTLHEAIFSKNKVLTV